MKIIKYKLCAVVENGTLDEPNHGEVFIDKEIRCSESSLDANIKVAESEAYNGEYTVEDDGVPEPEVPSNPESNPEGEMLIWDELDAAYQEGVDSV